MKKTKLYKSPPKKCRTEEDDDETNIRRSLVQSGFMKLRKATVKSNENSLNYDQDVICDKCSCSKDQIVRAVRMISQYIEGINDRINMSYHKVVNKNDMDFSLPIEYYHTICYSGLDSLNLSSDVLSQFRNLMKVIRIFNDKFDYITKKHENYESRINEYVNCVLSNKVEEISHIDDSVKDYTVQNIFTNFNQAKENIESIIKELKSDRNMATEGNKTFEMEVYEGKTHNESFLKNELIRLNKENISLKLEMNIVYERLREENKLYELKEDKVFFRDGIRDSLKDSTYSPDLKSKNKKIFSYNSLNSGLNSSPNIMFKVSSENKDEWYVNVQNFIKNLKQSEFYL